MLDGSISTTLRAKRGMKREWRLHALSVFSLSVAFVCLGAALLVLTNLHAVEERWSRAGRVSVYVRDEATPETVDGLRLALEQVPGVTHVRYVTRAEARDEFGQREARRDGELAALPEEAFPTSLEIDVGRDMSSADLAAMSAKLRKLPAVDDVETYEAWTSRLARLLGGGVAAAALLALVVFSSVLAVVGSTMRLALQRRRVEVEVLRLVGATDRFVKGPFLVEGTVQGALGATAALALLGTLFLLVRGRLDSELAGLLGVDPTFLSWSTSLGMVAVGALLGTTAAALGLRKLVTV